MGFISSASRKVVVVLIYLLTFLGFFEMKDILFSLTTKSLEVLFVCLTLAMVVSYSNGFELFKGPFPKKK